MPGSGPWAGSTSELITFLLLPLRGPEAFEDGLVKGEQQGQGLSLEEPRGLQELGWVGQRWLGVGVPCMMEENRAILLLIPSRSSYPSCCWGAGGDGMHPPTPSSGLWAGQGSLVPWPLCNSSRHHLICRQSRISCIPSLAPLPERPGKPCVQSGQHPGGLQGLFS